MTSNLSLPLIRLHKSGSVEKTSDWFLKNNNLLRAIDKSHVVLLAEGFIEFDKEILEINYRKLEFDSDSHVKDAFHTILLKMP